MADADSGSGNVANLGGRGIQFKASKGENDKIYFVDGVHPIHNAMPAYGWIKKGCEKPLPTNTGRARLHQLSFFTLRQDQKRATLPRRAEGNAVKTPLI
jgi:hypothetical protein